MARICRVIQIQLQSDSLRKKSIDHNHDHRFTNKALFKLFNLSAITVTNISQSFLPVRGRQKLTGIDMEENYVTVAVCIRGL